MRKYETLLLLDPELGTEGRETLLNDLTAVIKREGGEMIKVDDWGQKELAYQVNKVTRGRYVRLEYGVPGKKVDELERNIRISDDIFKFLTVKLDDEFEQEAS